jgi:hypothetical protein
MSTEKIPFGTSTSTSSSVGFTIGTSTRVSDSAIVPAKPRIDDNAVKREAIRTAVYNHIRAVRALGRTQVLPAEVAAALGLSERDVLTALATLEDKGVKKLAP